MTRLNIALIAIAALFAGGLASNLWLHPAPGLSESEVRTIVGEELAKTDTAAKPDPAPSVDAATLDPMIESYLMANPSILEKMSVALTAERKVQQDAANREAIAALHDKIFNDEGQVVIGNPDGDVTLVEMFDYNCSYCRRALPDMAGLIAEDPNLRIVLKEFPILSQASADAARVALAAHRAGVDYWALHSALFSSRGQIDADTVLDEAKTLGLDPDKLAADASSSAVSDMIKTSYDIAQALDINGTPSYIIGDEIISGAVGIDALKTRIANMRDCGKTECEG